MSQTDSGSPHTPPPPQARAWVLRQAPRGARITSIRRLPGGTSSATHAVNVRHRTDSLHRFVLRRYTLADWLAREPDLAEREAGALDLLRDCDEATPRLVAVDPSGAEAGLPSVLMNRLPGRIKVEAPATDGYLRQLAAPLPALHALQVPLSFTKQQRYDTYTDLAALVVPTWSHEPTAWQIVIDAARAPRPPTAWTFIHRDYHPGNIVWSRGRLSGIVDWVNASYGPPGIDVGHCRLNLAILFGRETADRFLDAYLSLPESHPYQAHWDCRTVIDFLPAQPNLEQWHDVGRIDLTTTIARRRIDDYVASLAARL